MIRNLTGLTAAAVLTMGATGAMAQERWDMPVAYPASNYHTEYCEMFADLVRDGTDGAIDIIVHANGSLYGGGEIKRAVQTGQAQLGERLISALANEDPLFGIDAIPFLASDFDSAWDLYQASRPALEELLASQNLVFLYAVPWPPQGLYINKALETVEDMRGVRFRAYNPATARLAEMTGAIPTTIEAAEVTQAFATGVVESMISSGATGYDTALWEHTSHFYDVQAWLPKNMIFINAGVWGGLDEATQQVILDAAAEVEAAGWARAAELADWYKEQLAANGMTVAAPGDALREGLQGLGAQMTDEWLQDAGDVGRSVVEAYRAM